MSLEITEEKYDDQRRMHKEMLARGETPPRITPPPIYTVPGEKEEKQKKKKRVNPVRPMRRRLQGMRHSGYKL